MTCGTNINVYVRVNCSNSHLAAGWIELVQYFALLIPTKLNTLRLASAVL